MSLEYLSFSTFTSEFSFDAEVGAGPDAEVTAGLSIDITSSGGNLETFTLDAAYQSSRGDPISDASGGGQNSASTNDPSDGPVN